MPFFRQIRDDDFARAGRFEIARAIGIAQHLRDGRDIEPSRFRARRIEGEAGRPLELLREHPIRLRLCAAGVDAEGAHASALALGHEDIAVGRDAKDARAVEIFGEDTRRKSRRETRRGILGRRGDLRAGGRRIAGERRGKIAGGNFPPHARRVVAPVGKSRGAL